MQPRTEEFLNFLLWNAERLLHRTFRNLTDSYSDGTIACAGGTGPGSSLVSIVGWAMAARVV